MSEEDYSKYYIQGSDHYLIPKDVFKELFNEINNWKEENKQLKEKNKALMLLLEWMTECDFGLDNIFNEEDINMTEEKFEKATENMEYNESLIYYAELYLQIIKGEDK